MEALHKSLQQFIRDHGLDMEQGKQLDQLLSSPFLKKWWDLHPELTRDDLGQSLSKVKQFVQENENCQACGGLHQCQNLMYGHCAQLFRYETILDVTYSPCFYFRQAKREENRAKLIQSHHIPKDILHGTFHDFDQEEEGRIDAFEAVLEFCKRTQPGHDGMGLYLYGPLGAGKSYLLGAACNQLAQRRIASYMVYTPEFFREMKGAIAEQKVDEKIQAFKQVPVLIFDDIGAETISAWARDEILGSILQYRVTEKLPTLYTSNYNFDQLEDHLSYSHKAGIEQLKAMRIMERIRHYTDAYFVDGSNRRERRKD